MHLKASSWQQRCRAALEQGCTGTGLHCNALQCGAVQSSAVECSAVEYSAVPWSRAMARETQDHCSQCSKTKFGPTFPIMKLAKVTSIWESYFYAMTLRMDGVRWLLQQIQSKKIPHTGDQSTKTKNILKKLKHSSHWTMCYSTIMSSTLLQLNKPSMQQHSILTTPGHWKFRIAMCTI